MNRDSDVYDADSERELLRSWGLHASIVPDDELVAALTHQGRIPIDRVYLLSQREIDSVRFWDDAEEAGYVMRFRDDAMMHAAISYLKKRGQAFTTWEQVLEWAESHGWSKVENLRQHAERMSGQRREV